MGYVDKTINTGMKSIGEVMAIGRNFQETFQKALRMVSANKIDGFEPLHTDKKTKNSTIIDNKAEFLNNLQHASPTRPFNIAKAFENNITIMEISKTTNIDVFFLLLLHSIHNTSKQIKSYNGISDLPKNVFRKAKQYGFRLF